MEDTIEPGRAGRRSLNVLVLDDEPDTVDMVSMALQIAGYQAWPAYSVDQALGVVARRGLPHLAIVDLMLPGRPGTDFCESIHAYSDVPCIILSAVGDPEMVVQGLQHFAEDYVIKPFYMRELLARVERVLLRFDISAYAGSPLIRVDDCLSVDFAHQRVIVQGRHIALTPTECKILYVLMRRAGQTLHTDFILCRVWPGDEVFEDTLRVHMHRLRQKIDAGSGQGPHIITERNVGYRFEPAQPG
jgi:DNA-binding response OmpR family regulator